MNNKTDRPLHVGPDGRVVMRNSDAAIVRIKEYVSMQRAAKERRQAGILAWIRRTLSR